jgi:hypothetical protein
MKDHEDADHLEHALAGSEHLVGMDDLPHSHGRRGYDRRHSIRQGPVITMNIVTIITRDLDEKPALEIAAARLIEWGFEAEVIETAKVTKTHKPQAILRTNAQVHTVRKARLNTMGGPAGVTAFNAMLATIKG